MSDPTQQYPGMWEEFRKWYREMSERHKEPSLLRDNKLVSGFYWEFLSGAGTTGFMPGGSGKFVNEPIPPHLISMRDMSLT